MPATIRQLRGTAKLKSWSCDDTDQGCAPFMRWCFAKEVFAGDTFEVEGNYDFGKSEEGSLVFPSGSRDSPANVIGMADATLKSGILSDLYGSAFVVWNTRLTNLRLVEATLTPNEDGRCLGFDIENKAGMKLRPGVDLSVGPSATVDKCNIVASAWGIYSWFDYPITLQVNNSGIASARLGLAMCASGSKPQNTSVQRTNFIIETSRSNDYGATSGSWGGGIAAVYKNGYHSLTDCTLNLNWTKPATAAEKFPAPRCVGIACEFDEDKAPIGHSPPQADTKIVVHNLVVNLNPGTADKAQCYDIDLQNPNVRKNLKLQGVNYGSGEFRTMRIR